MSDACLSAVCIPAVVMLPPLLSAILFQNSEMAYFDVAVLFLLFSFMTAVLYPLFFKIGVEKAWAAMSLLGIIALFVFILFKSSAKLRALFALQIPAQFVAAGNAAAGLILLYLSYKLSLKIYREKDL